MNYYCIYLNMNFTYFLDNRPFAHLKLNSKITHFYMFFLGVISL